MEDKLVSVQEPNHEKVGLENDITSTRRDASSSSSRPTTKKTSGDNDKAIAEVAHGGGELKCDSMGDGKDTNYETGGREETHCRDSSSLSGSMLAMKAVEARKKKEEKADTVTTTNTNIKRVRTATCSAITPSMRNRPGAIAVQGIDARRDDETDLSGGGDGRDVEHGITNAALDAAVATVGNSSTTGAEDNHIIGEESGLGSSTADRSQLSAAETVMTNEPSVVVATALDEDEHKEQLRQEILSQAVEAKRVEFFRSTTAANRSANRLSKKSRIIIFGSGFAVLVIVTVLAITLGIERGRRKSSSGAGVIRTGDVKPTQAPTVMLDTDNDSCENARVIVTSENSSSVSKRGSFMGTTTHDTAPVCTLDENWDWDPSNYGRWYEYVGKGIPVTLKLQKYTEAGRRVRAIIYTGEFCTSLTCVREIQASFTEDDSFEDNEKIISWRGRNEVHYHILISGQSEEDTYEFDLVESDQCDYAYPINKLPRTLPGRTRAARPGAAGFACDESKNPTNVTAGLFFSVIGTGKPIEASTCNNPAMNTQISVFTGTCEDRVCVAFNDDACHFQSRVAFPTIKGEVYYILVHGKGNAKGTFTLDVKELVENALCETAIGPIPPNQTGVRVPEGSTSDLSILSPTCNISASISGGGVWYYIHGTGSTWEVSDGLEFPELSLDPPEYIFTFTGDDCDTLQCVAGNTSSNTWKTEKDRTYWILILSSDSYWHALDFKEVNPDRTRSLA